MGEEAIVPTKEKCGRSVFERIREPNILIYPRRRPTCKLLCAAPKPHQALRVCVYTRASALNKQSYCNTRRQTVDATGIRCDFRAHPGTRPLYNHLV